MITNSPSIIVSTIGNQ